MKNKELAQRVKTLRNRKGFSQEELSERTGLSLRTVQRIENGETEPRGDSLKRLAMAFDVSPDEVIDLTVHEDKGFLSSLNLSALSFIVFPILGILVPLIIWISKKDKIKNVNAVARDLLNFQVTWTMLLFVGYMVIMVGFIFRMQIIEDISPMILHSRYLAFIGFFGVMYLYNMVLVIINTVRINNDKNTGYYPRIGFIRM